MIFAAQTNVTGEVFGDLFSMMTSRPFIAATLFGVSIVFFMYSPRFLHHNPLQTYSFLIAGVCSIVGAGILAVGAITGMLMDDSPDSQPESNPTPKPEPADPIDLSWVLPVLGVVTAILALAALTYYSWRFISSKRRTAARRQKQLDELIERHDSLLAEWFTHTCEDIDLILRYPVLSSDEHEIVEHQKAMERARDLRPDSLADIHGDVVSSPYYTAVADMDHCWQSCLRLAKQHAEAGLTAKEAKLLQRARAIWPLVNSASTPAEERKTAARRLEDIMNELRLLGDKGKKNAAAAALSRVTRGELEGVTLCV